MEGEGAAGSSGGVGATRVLWCFRDNFIRAHYWCHLQVNCSLLGDRKPCKLLGIMSQNCNVCHVLEERKHRNFQGLCHTTVGVEACPCLLDYC